MIRIDEDYTKYRIDDDPAYPGGKAKAVSAGNRTDGTPWRALWFNTILGFFQAVIVEAKKSFEVSGVPDKVGASDILDALTILMKAAVNPNIDSRVSANTKDIERAFGLISGCTLDIKTLVQYTKGLTEEAPEDGRTYGRKNKTWVEVEGAGSSFGDAVKAFKFYSEESIMLTNARTADRRARGWDIGLPYLSGTSRVYHFDTDTLDQNQQTNITINYTQTPPVLVGKEDTDGNIYYNPAVKETPPFEMCGRSLLGKFSISASVPEAHSTVEFWVRYTKAASIVVIRAGNPGTDEVIFNIVSEDPLYSQPVPPACVYSAAASGGIEYSEAEAGGIEYSAAAAGETAYSTADSDGVLYEAAESGRNYIVHNYSTGTQEIPIPESAAIKQNVWFHTGLCFKESAILIYINKEQISIERKGATTPDAAVPFIINEEEDELNVDELMLDESVAEDFESFCANTQNRIPYAALDYKDKYAVFMVDNTDLFKTNIFEGQAFKDAVNAVIHG